MIDISIFTFWLFNRSENGELSYIILSIDPDTGETINFIKSNNDSGDSTNIEPLFLKSLDVIDKNSKSFYQAYSMYDDWMADYNPVIHAGTKPNLRINHLTNVIGYYFDWFKTKRIPLPNLTKAPGLLFNERTVMVSGEEVPLNERQHVVLHVLRNSKNPISTRKILIMVDGLLRTVTSYTRVSEIFKHKREVFNSCIERPSKGYYKLKDNF